MLIDWNNVDLTSPHERAQDIMDGYSFETLLLEVSCNMGSGVNETLLREHFEMQLLERAREARLIFAANFNNILDVAKKENR